MDSITSTQAYSCNRPYLQARRQQFQDRRFRTLELGPVFCHNSATSKVNEHCKCCSEDSTTTEAHLAKLFSDLEKKKAKTSGITEKLGITNVWEHWDAAENFEKILCLTSPEASKIFKGELNHWTRCLQCKQRNDSGSLFWILPLAVEDSSRQIYSVEKGLEAFFRGERVSRDNKVYCNHCNKKHNAKFGCEITQHPEILTLLLKRFSFDNKHQCYVKLHCVVEVPETLHMKNCTYDLYALVHHCGDLTGGHYTSHIKSFETQGWYHFNDDVVKGVRQSLFGESGKCLKSSTAYLLMYRKGPESDGEGACSINVDVGAERRHEKAEREEPLIPHHQLEDECSREENWKHLNGGLLNQNHHDVVLKTQRNFSYTLENHLNHEMACLREPEALSVANNEFSSYETEEGTSAEEDFYHQHLGDPSMRGNGGGYLSTNHHMRGINTDRDKEVSSFAIMIEKRMDRDIYKFKAIKIERLQKTTNAVEMAVKLYVKKLDGKTLEVILCDTEEKFRSVTTLELKSKMNCEEGIPEDQMILVFAGQRLEDDKCLYDYEDQMILIFSHQVLKDNDEYEEEDDEEEDNEEEGNDKEGNEEKDDEEEGYEKEGNEEEDDEEEEEELAEDNEEDDTGMGQRGWSKRKYGSAR
ncbi:ubiquitin carboxyl-terminal hydrolase 17-like protein D [Cheilinus undulatus]|uniref:ubiquitin carboxyl-terminal hydrolase 17-like protein D n=1 Tax=Cheilinus undulatus TaxID=241271 RepID=UPI001BD3B7F7|nr:ubiquitin carboxyl-terminal hydrolase 17-like protein D [Cheilinus undulatus]